MCLHIQYRDNILCSCCKIPSMVGLKSHLSRTTLFHTKKFSVQQTRNYTRANHIPVNSSIKYYCIIFIQLQLKNPTLKTRAQLPLLILQYRISLLLSQEQIRSSLLGWKSSDITVAECPVKVRSEYPGCKGKH